MTLSPAPPSGVPCQPTHHLPDHGLVEYVAGACTDGAALAFACHLSLCASCAAEAAALEDVGGRILEASEGQTMAPGALEALLARLETTPQLASPPADRATAPDFLAACGLPATLLRALPPADGWRSVLPGMRVVDLPFAPPGGAVRLVRFTGGVTIPLHDHGGPSTSWCSPARWKRKTRATGGGSGEVTFRSVCR